MGIAADLGYSFLEPNPVQRSMQLVASSRAGAWTLARTLPSMDRAVARLTKGRMTLAEVLSALPVVVVTTTGRKSGQPRDAQLTAVPFDEDLALIGTNFGQSSTPTWALNLEADPRATVTFRNVTVAVTARAASVAERTQILPVAQGYYMGYGRYLSRISGRHVRIFVLEAPVTA